ncbi:hypothetical protein Tco_1136797 [Tanacetum coccineum]
MPSPLLPSPGCPTQIQTLKIASTQALIDVVTAALPSPPLPPLPPLPPSLCIPPPVNHRDDLPKSELPPRKRLCLSTLGSRYEIRESSTARPIGDSVEAVPEVAPMTVGEVNTRVTELAELHEHDTHDLYALLEDSQDRDSMDYEGGGLCFLRGLGSLDRIESGDPSGALNPSRSCVCTRDPYPGISGTATAAGYSHSDTAPETLRVMRDMRREMSDMLAKLLAHREQQRRARQPGPDARILDHQDASGRLTVTSSGSCFHYTGNDVPAYTEHFQELTLICTKFYAHETEKINKYIRGLLDNIYGNVKSSKPKTLDETIELTNDLMDQKLRTYAEKSDNKRKAEDSSRNNHGHQQQPFKK